MNHVFKMLWLIASVACTQSQSPDQGNLNNTAVVEEATAKAEEQTKLVLECGADRMEAYLPKLRGKRIAVVANQTSVIENTHLVDTLLARGVEVIKVFGPEHGFRGNTGAGDKVSDEVDEKTGLPIFSLYGASKKPNVASLADVDLVVFDIQDVGARFYTYLSTMHYVMEACAENAIPLMILDRPNPHGDYVDGPVLDLDFQSFIGMHPIPVVHGMTLAELAQMIAGENWIAASENLELEIIGCSHWDHTMTYTLPISPSPNLPTQASILLYPSLCFFEGTQVSIGRGTDLPFEVMGFPQNTNGAFEFTPRPIPGKAPFPKHDGKICIGTRLSPDSLFSNGEKRLQIEWLVDMYSYYPSSKDYFLANHFIDKLAGTDELREMVLAGKSAAEIRASWEDDLENFKAMRKKYLLYGDF